LGSEPERVDGSAPLHAVEDTSTDPTWSLRRVVLGVVVTTAAVTAISYATPDAYVATAVGLGFLAATYVLVLRHSAGFVAAHGLSLGGLFEPTRLSPARLARDGVTALAWALGFFTIVAVPFALGFRAWFPVRHAFDLRAALGALDTYLGQLLVIALPEETFFRGFVQSELEPLFTRRVRVFGAEVSPAIVVASAIFAVGHLLTSPQPSRLAVFFPSLLFGFLRTRTRGVGAGVLFHASCNVLSSSLSRGFGLS
jgi:membrane protease YdiL (CAAX protease family)